MTLRVDEKTDVTVMEAAVSLPPGTVYRGSLWLLDEPLTALFCSNRCPGGIILKTYDLARAMRDAGVPVIGGFQTPMERECLRLLLRGAQPRDWRTALDEDRLLVLSPFTSTVRRPTAQLAAQRNDLVSELAHQVFIAHAAPGSKTEAFARKLAATGKPLLTLDSPANGNLVEIGTEAIAPERVSKSFDRLLRILGDSPIEANGRVRLGDARTLRGVRPASVDAVVTSPPYINAIDYLRGHKLALVWLGFATPKIRNIKSLGVGSSTRHQRQESNRLNGIVRTASVEDLSPNIERVVKRYVHDMAACLKQTYRVLRPGGYAVYVVSNSMLRGVEVDTAKIIVETASDAGLQLEDSYVRDIPREHRYLPPPQATANSQLATRMRTESVLRFQKNNGQGPQ